MKQSTIINIAYSAVIAVCVLGIGITLPKIIEKQNDKVADQDKSQDNSDKPFVSECASMPAITTLSKAETLALVEESFSSDALIHEACNFVPKNVKATSDVVEFISSFTDLKTLDAKVYLRNKGGMQYADDFTVDKTDNRYVVISGRQGGNPVSGDQDILGKVVLFDEADLKLDEKTYSFTFIKKDKQYIADFMNIWIYGNLGQAAKFTGTSLYSYDLVDKGDSYEYQLSYVLLDILSLYQGVGKLNVMQFTYSIDKKTGELADPNQALDPIKTFDLTEAELEKIKKIAG